MSFFRRPVRASRRREPQFELEPLEDRVYLSLVPTAVAGPLPASLIALQKINNAVTIDLNNSGSAAIKGKYTLTLFADKNPTLDGTQTQIVSENENLGNLAAGKNTSVKVKLGEFPDVPNGNYYILAEVSGPLAGTDNVAPSATTIAIADPFISLVDSYAITSPKSRSLVAGQALGTELEITNEGNVAAKGSVPIQILISTSSTGSPSDSYFTFNESINLAPGAHTIFHFTHVTKTTDIPGTYYLVAVVDPDNKLIESNTLADRTTVTPTTITIVSPYPDVVGTYAVSGKVTTGSSKGASQTITIVITGQNNLGALTGTISVLGNSVALAGTITVSGKITITGTISGQPIKITGTISKGALIGTSATIGGLIPAVPTATLVGDYTGDVTPETGKDAGKDYGLEIDITSEDSQGDLQGTVSADGGSLPFASGTYQEATGKFTIILVDEDSKKPVTITFTGNAFDGGLSGDVTGQDDTAYESGTFSVSEDI